MKLYNTLTRKKEEFIPLQEGKVSMYVLRAYGVQSDPYRKCQAHDRLRYSQKIHGI